MTFFLKKDIAATFDRAVNQYDAAAVLPQEICHRMMERLALIRIHPDAILDLGAGTGNGTQLLKKYYPQAHIISLDLASKMLSHSAYLKNDARICADAASLPIANNSMDLVFSNLMLPWCNDPETVFREVHRILKPNGLFLFSTFGPDTLKELRFSWARVEDLPHVHLFYDLHDVGDVLLRTHFADPVMDMEMLTLTYKTARQSMKELKACGMQNILMDRRKGLTGKHLFQRFMAHYETWSQPNQPLPNTYEVNYGHAWKTAPSPKARSNEVRIPVSEIKTSHLTHKGVVA